MRALAHALAVRAHAPLPEVHQAMHDEEPEAGTVLAARATRMQARESLEQARAVRGAKAHTTVAHRQLRSEEHTSELQSRLHLVCRLLLEKKKSRTFACRHDGAAELD